MYNNIHYLINNFHFALFNFDKILKNPGKDVFTHSISFIKSPLSLASAAIEKAIAILWSPKESISAYLKGEEAKILSNRIIILNKGRIAKIIEDPKNIDIKEAFLNEDK